MCPVIGVQSTTNLQSNKKNTPDILIIPKDGYLIPYRIYINKKIWNDETSDSFWSGIHSLYGIFYISEPGIRKNHEIKNIKNIDLAPTILHLFNIPIPNDMDGIVLIECFEEESELAKREIIFQDVEKIKRLKIKYNN